MYDNISPRTFYSLPLSKKYKVKILGNNIEAAIIITCTEIATAHTKEFVL